MPRGTHDWTRFISPVEFVAALSRASSSEAAAPPLRVAFAAGLKYDVLREAWALDTDLSVNYIALATSEAKERD